ncbi:unnamed protein product [Cunninghamella blakesleeana]
MVTATTPALFTPVKVSQKTLKHRVVLAPLTRMRSDANGVPMDFVPEYYQQRATEGGLLITEATGISPSAGSYPSLPSIYSEEQIEAWKKVTDAVHKKGGIIALQILHLGRATWSSLRPNKDQTVSASAIAIKGNNLIGQPHETPRALTVDEIHEITQDFATAAKNAVRAGFDIVEIHGANGYLVDQFTNSSSNKRTDQYGGSIENRSRFALEVVDAIANAIGEEKTAIRFSPWSGFQDMKDDTPVQTWSYLTQQLQNNHPNLAYLHFVEPRTNIFADSLPEGEAPESDTLDHFRNIWKGPFIVAGNYTYDYNLAYKVAEKSSNTLVAFGRSFIANPDLVYRIQNHLPLNKYDRSTFYVPGSPKGYTDYPFYEESKQ